MIWSKLAHEIFEFIMSWANYLILTPLFMYNIIIQNSLRKLNKYDGRIMMGIYGVWVG